MVATQKPLLQLKAVDLMSRSLQAQADSSDYQVQMLTGIETLKAAGAEGIAVSHWSNLLVDTMNASLERGRLMGLAALDLRPRKGGIARLSVGRFLERLLDLRSGVRVRGPKLVRVSRGAHFEKHRFGAKERRGEREERLEGRRKPLQMARVQLDGERAPHGPNFVAGEPWIQDVRAR